VRYGTHCKTFPSTDKRYRIMMVIQNDIIKAEKTNAVKHGQFQGTGRERNSWTSQVAQ
jgi:hypothetical protein